jgi:hypothetical protein
MIFANFLQENGYTCDVRIINFCNYKSIPTLCKSLAENKAISQNSSYRGVTALGSVI